MAIEYVDLAQPFEFCNMGSMGKARSMLIVQNNFPESYNRDTEKISAGYLDRLHGFDESHTDATLKKYKLQAYGLDSQLRELKPEKCFAFLCEIMKEDPALWTGYRVLGTVGGNGHPYYCFQLFAKHLESSTEVYSGDSAPNVYTS